MPKPAKKAGDLILIVTPTTIEWEAMRGKMSHTKRADEDSPAVRGTIGSFDVLCAMPGKGPGATAAVAMQLIERHGPRYVLLVGVAGGLGGVRRGDLVVPTAVHDLDYGKVEGGEFRRRKEYDWTPDQKLLQYAHLVGESATNKWRNRIRTPRPDKKTSAASDTYFGYVGSSGKVVDDSDYSVIQDALKTATELLAVEMEATGAGAAVRAAQSGAHVGLLMVRGISDLVSASSTGKGAGTNQRRKWKAYAADVAATFAATLLKELSPKRQKESPTGSTPTEEVDASETADESIAILAATVSEVLRKIGAPGSAVSIAEEPVRRTFDAPPAVAKVVRRAETIAAFSREIQSRTWTAITGPRGSGKTHLAILLSDRFPSAKWLRPEDLREVEIFEQRLREIGAPIDGTPAESACAGLGRGGILILDDVPTDKADVVTAFAAFAVVAARHEVHVISLSAGSLPATIRRAFADGGYSSTAVPDFSNEEAEELLRMYGAPDEVHGHVEFLNASAHRNPTLLTAVAEYLRGRAWKLGGDEVVRILSRAHLAEIEPETLQRLLTDVKDENTRGLFHRLRLARQKLSFATIAALAAVEPKIDRVRERLFDLEGLWVRRSAPDVFEVVHLAEALPARALDPGTERNCHVVVARTIVGKRKITPTEAVSAVSHFTAGGDVNGAGAALGHALSSIVANKAWHETLLPSIWATEPLPKAMKRSLRLYIRLQQVKIARATRSDAAFLSTDLKDLIGDAKADDAGLLAAIAFDVALKRRVAGALWDLAMTALERLAPMIPKDGQLSIGEQELPAKTWMVAFHLTGRSAKSVEQIERWARTIDSLHADLRAQLFTSAEFNAVSLVDEWWLRAVDEKADKEELELLLKRFETIERWTSDPESELLGAAAARARIIVAGEYIEDLPRAVAIGEQAISSYQSEVAQFLLREAIGTQYSVAGKFETAEGWLMSALDHATSTTLSRRITALLRAAQAAGRRDPKRTVELLEEALRVARRGPTEDILPHQLAQVLGDLGIAASLADDLRRAFEVWAEAANLILSSDLRRPIWRGMSAILDVALAYPALQLRMGRAPIVPATGEVVAQPLVGIFLRDLAREGAGYKPEFRTQIAMSLTYIASAIGDREATRMWAMRAYEEANAQADAERSSLIAVELLPFSLLDDDVAGALRLIEERILTIREEARTEATESGAGLFLHFLILVIFRVCRLALDDEEKARALFATLREWALANLHGITREAFAAVCDAALRPGGRVILEGLYQRDDLPPSMLLIARLVHSLDHGSSTANRAADHLTIALGVSHRAFMWGMAYSWIVLEFFETYWMRELLLNGFRFASPAEVRRALAASSLLPIGERLQAMLLTVADGVGVRLAEDFRHAISSRKVEVFA